CSPLFRFATHVLNVLYAPCKPLLLCMTGRLIPWVCRNCFIIMVQTSLTGSGYSKPVQLFAQSFGLPTQVTWSLEGRHDFYCGIFTSMGDKFLCGSHGMLACCDVQFLDGTIRVFDSSQKYFRLIKEINYPFPHWSVVSMNLSRDERCLAYSLLACNVYLSSLDDVSGGNEVSLIGQSHNQRGISKTFTVCFDGSGTHLYTGHNAGFFGVYDIPTGSSECVPVSPSATRDVNAVTTIDQAGNVILAGGDDTNIRHLVKPIEYILQPHSIAGLRKLAISWRISIKVARSVHHKLHLLLSITYHSHITWLSRFVARLQLFDTRVLSKGALAVFVGHMDGITYLDTNVAHPCFSFERFALIRTLKPMGSIFFRTARIKLFDCGICGSTPNLALNG
ncbi:WD repeat-containing protein 23, partial [Paragonimus westermani]